MRYRILGLLLCWLCWSVLLFLVPRLDSRSFFSASSSLRLFLWLFVVGVAIGRRLRTGLCSLCVLFVWLLFLFSFCLCLPGLILIIICMNYINLSVFCQESVTKKSESTYFNKLFTFPTRVGGAVV